jgi:hypothetical protein
MSGWEITFRGRAHGPIEEHRMDHDAHAYSHDVAEALAEDAEDIWVRNLQGSIRHPTPYYWTRIDKREVTPTRYEVHDHDIVYGPWLEGTGSRNETTIFKGYWSMARAKEMVKRRRGNIARRILREYRSSGRLT